MASSPSQVHFGHYIAGVADDLVGKLNALLANERLANGTAPQRWRKTLNVMLEKLAGNDNVEKLRIIMLFEADFNHNNKWLGRATMRLAEHNKLIAPEQYGSRKSKSAGTQCLNKCLFYDLHRFTRTPAALCSNDAKSCYNRIILMIAALCLCRLGAPHSAVKSMITTLANLKHHVRTAYGDSEISQGQDNWKDLAAGIGQGNGAGPQIWAAVSTPLFAILRAEGFVAQIICAMTKTSTELAGLAFVDDTDLIINDPSNDAEQVNDKMQRSLSTWHGILRATGGELVPEKCFWYLIDFKWANKEWKYKRSNELKGHLSITQSRTGTIIIPRLEPDEARRTLGVRIAPDGNNLAEAHHLHGVANEWAKHMARAHPTRAEAEFSLRQVLLPKLTYALQATTFDEQQCAEIMKPALSKALPAMGINRHFPRAVAYGPKSHQGLAIPNLFTEQIITHITTLLRYGPQAYDPTGQLLQANLEAFRVETGLSGQIFGQPEEILPCLTSTWITHTWTQCRKLNIDIMMEGPDFELPRQNDRELMKIFLQHGARGQELATLNRCRMYIQAIYLSDICNGLGTAVDTQFWSGDHKCSTPYRWPRTEKPTNQEWQEWRRTITQACQLG